ncbi:esterase-like activity of phytase family protein [Azorhizobium doebereinerae]|uniref:esterase-like activity of phytase family protein n=1 Tax=Azorhizobium doebereinerae TaxID=281091 RepID=UPI00041951DA|nr:esterase-like activity of phytase family protein [Azorhizobium doebereinerae]
MALLTRRTLLASLLVGVGGVALGHRAFSKPRDLPLSPVPVEVKATPIERFRIGSDETRFGRLEFRGGLTLTSTFSGFGGISAFTLDAAGAEFLAVTDASVFLRGRLKSDGDRPVGLTDVTAAALRDDKGGLLATQGREDSESIAVSPGGIYVGLETVNEIWLYPAPNPLGRPGKRVEIPPEVQRLRRNTGLESLVYVPDGALAGTLIGIGEEGATDRDDLPGFLVGGPAPGIFTIAKSGLFDATDAALGPGGTLFLLERHYAVSTGVSMQIRRFALADVKPGARLAGEVLFTGDMAYEVDNMEGLAVTRNAAGETLLTVISDDNFSPLQRTILLRFAVTG